MPAFSGLGRLAVAAAALACVAALAGCASSPSTPQSATSTSTATVTASNPATSSSAPSTAPPSAPGSSLSPAVATGTPACPNGSLNVTQGVAQGYAGGVYQVIDFTNTSGSTCTLTGYPGASLVSGPSDTQIGLAAKRSTATPVVLVTLAPGAAANALLQIVDALNFPNASCAPTKATDLKIYPPNQTVPVLLPNTSEACANPVQTMFIGAVRPGSGSSA